MALRHRIGKIHKVGLFALDRQPDAALKRVPTPLAPAASPTPTGTGPASRGTSAGTCFEKLMGDDFEMNMRERWVRMFDNWVPYPFQNNIRHLTKQVTYECLSGLVKAQAKGDHKTAKNFREFIDKVFGDGIAKHFMIPYNFKVWAHPPR